MPAIYIALKLICIIKMHDVAQNVVKLNGQDTSVNTHFIISSARLVSYNTFSVRKQIGQPITENTGMPHCPK